MRFSDFDAARGSNRSLGACIHCDRPSSRPHQTAPPPAQTAPAPAESSAPPSSGAEETTYTPPPPQPVVSAYQEPPTEQPPPVEVGWAPPPMLVDPPPPAPAPQYVWTGGYWAWYGNWVWVAGRWAPPPRPHYHWVQPYYDHRHGHVIFVTGFWAAPSVSFVAPGLGLSLTLGRALAGRRAGTAPDGTGRCLRTAAPRLGLRHHRARADRDAARRGHRRTAGRERGHADQRERTRRTSTTPRLPTRPSTTR